MNNEQSVQIIRKSEILFNKIWNNCDCNYRDGYINAVKGTSQEGELLIDIHERIKQHLIEIQKFKDEEYYKYIKQ